MSFHIGLDIGGTKIAGAVFADDGREIDQRVAATPPDYPAFLAACAQTVAELDRKCGGQASIGIGVPGAIDRESGTIFAPNIPCLEGNTFQKDMEKNLGRPVSLGNDANCAALSEALDGAGAGHHAVFGAIMGTGVGGGFIVGGKIVEGANGLTGEWGHLPLPFREEGDGPVVACGCGQTGCIDKTISGPALSRLYETLSGKSVDAGDIGEMARGGDATAKQALDRFYTTVAKAMVTVIHTFDPDIIVVGGGLNNHPGLYEEVPKRWSKYALRKNLKTRFVPSKHGAMSGLRGAAWLGRAQSK